MAKTPAEFEQEFIQTAQQKTGKSLAQWLELVKSSDFSKQMEILNWLKNEHNLNHMQAGFVASIFLNDGKLVYQNTGNLLDNQFNKCEGIRPLYDAVAEKIRLLFPETQVIPKKTYVSFTAQREFAAINIKPAEIRLGFDLGSRAFDETLLRSKLTGPMPRISHMLILKDISDLNAQVTDYLSESYYRTNK
jgi:hypothetical protein